MHQTDKEQLYTLKEACEQLGISVATGRNWVKSGRLIPERTDQKKSLLFSSSSVRHLKNGLTTGSVSALKSRRNKAYISGTSSYRSYIDERSGNHAAFDRLSALPDAKEEHLLPFFLRDCAEKLIKQSGACFSACLPLLQDLADDITFHHFLENHPLLCDITYDYEPTEDTLGFLYLSLRNLNDRKGSGSYYTPFWLAKHLITEHLLPVLTKSLSGTSVLDPSCGCGMFLLQLPEAFPLKKIYGCDIDALSVTLTRINLAMKYRISSADELKPLYHNIFIQDFLTYSPAPADLPLYDIILGNPPWGARISDAQIKSYRPYFSCARQGSVDSSDMFLEQSLRLMAPDGILAFVLPEAILNVKSHQPVRAHLLSNSKALSVEYLGEVFEQVHCPSIIFTVKKMTDRTLCKDKFAVGTKVSNKTATFLIQNQRAMTDECFSFSVSDEEYAVLTKILNHSQSTTLKGHANFALGIVTGNNSLYLHSEPVEDMEPVLKGSDISKYHINSSSGYLKFLPEYFQQTAPEPYYRAEKLFYRFISRRLIFAYDDTGLLSLNSCNIVIPQIEGLHIKYILAILNSNIAQFVFEKKYSSVKVLRSHLEAIPIPLADSETQKRLISYVDFLISSNENSREYIQTLQTLESEIKALYHLTDAEYTVITTAI